jgi:single-stranded-DNA-specific exonuclease
LTTESRTAPPRPGAKRWRLRGRFPEGELRTAPFPALIRHLLWHRGIRTVNEAAAFMDGAQTGGRLPEPLDYDPLLLPDAGPALDRLREAIRKDEIIAVYGDFDVDGVTASVILIESLLELGARVHPYLPDRFSEGYGVNDGAIDTLAAAGVKLIITADCGTSSVAEIAHASSLGIDTIVADHHTVPPQLPDAVAIVNPKRTDNRYPETELATGGLAFKLMSALYNSFGRAYDAERYLDLVALSTVCDMAPLRGENRILVQRGLAALSRTQRPGLTALMEAAGVDPDRADTDTIGYAIGPRLNAAGRLAHARMALDLLMERDPSTAMIRALELTTLNKQRQDATAAALKLARELLAEEDPNAPLIFVGHEEIPSGIVGLVAGRLTEERNRPAVVYERGESTSRASCRSIPEFDITAALRRHAELMVRFGGHRAAAGFTVENASLGALKDAMLTEAARELASVDLTPVIDVDAAIPLHRVNGDLIRLLSRMAPFGQGNPTPTFLSRNLEITDVKVLGDEGHHLRLRLKDHRQTWPAIAFGVGAENIEAMDPQPGQRYDVVYSFSADRRANNGLELMVQDLAPSDSVAAER